MDGSVWQPLRPSCLRPTSSLRLTVFPNGQFQHHQSRATLRSRSPCASWALPLHRGLVRGFFPAPHHHDPNETLSNFQIWVMVVFPSPVTAGERLRDQGFLRAGCGCVINASRRCGVPATGCCGTGPSRLSPLSSSPVTHRVWGSRCRGSSRSRRMRGWRPPDSGAVILEVRSSTCSASHTLLPSASAAPQGPEVRGGPFHVLGLRFVSQGSAGVPVASCCGSGKSSDVAASSLLTVAAAAPVPVHAVSGGTRKYLFISSSLHRPFDGCFLLHAAKLVEVGRNIAVLSLGEGSCDDDLPDQAPKLVKFVDTAVVPSLAMDGVTTRRELLGSFVGRRWEC